LGQRGKLMEDERVNVRTKLSHYERHAVRH
jgi:hypothetical protein